MNKLLTFLILFTLAAANPPESSAQKSGKTRKDSLCITSSGSQNQVIINTKKVTQINDCIDSLAVNGEIVQRGEKNSVEINTGKKSQAASRKPQAENRNQLKRSGNPETSGKPATNNKQSAGRRTGQQPATRNVQHVTISQSGKNNTVKINSR